jgi:hypothetical protein
MAFQGVNSTIGGRTTSTNKSNYNKTHQAQDVAYDAFIVWWNKILAQHTAVIAQASAFVRLHRRVNSVDEAYVEQSH